MKMIGNFEMGLLAFRIERKWEGVARNRAAMDRLLARGERYTSPRLVRLDAQTAKLGYSARELAHRYIALQNRKAIS